MNADIQTRLLAWSRSELRDLPWRQTRDPWRILVSEIMLQQTQVSRVIDRYHEFIERFPTPVDCAQAPTAAVIELWAGLGYNRRAVNLWRAAVDITDQHNGVIPNDLASLQALPGIGPYTARAVLAFAFEQDVGVVDTNVGRLLARWTGSALPAKKAQQLATSYVPEGGGWLWNQGLFDFAVAICTKREPNCEHCPLAEPCVWQGGVLQGGGADPAAGSAFVSGKQATFEGSERQVRGRIVHALRNGPLPFASLADFARDGDTETDVERIVSTLVADGLAVQKDAHLVLPS